MSRDAWLQTITWLVLCATKCGDSFQVANGLIPCRLLPHIKGNVGFVFTKEDLVEVRDLLLSNKVRRVFTFYNGKNH